MWQKMRKSELYNLLNKITIKFMNKESPTVKEVRRLEKLTNEDLFIMEDDGMESFIFGMWSGVESFIKEQEVLMGIKLNTIQKHGKLNEITRLEEGNNEYGYHEYLIEGLSDYTDQENGIVVLEKISFQNGARFEPGSKHGVTDQDLLEIVRDRLTGFMQGELPSEETEKALEHVEIALRYLNKRVVDRMERNILGKYEK